MGRAQESFSKREREKQRIKKQQDKKEKMSDRKSNKEKGKGIEHMMAYLDENGNLTDKPTDPQKRREFKQEDIMISIPKREDLPDDVPRTGIISFFNHDKGFGFITDLATQERIFVHATELSFPAKENDKVSFEPGNGPKGLVALNVTALK